MRRPWMPFYVADYLQDTGHLSPTEHGAYLLLILHYWANGKLPPDEETIRRITRLTPRQWSHSCDILRSLFLPGWVHKRIDSELSQAFEKSKVNSANAKRRHSGRTSSAKRSQTHTHTQSDTDSKIPPIPPKRGADCRDDWPDNFLDAFWELYPPGRKQDKAKVGRKLAKLRADKTVTWSALMEGLGKFIASAPRPQYTAAPIVWLNNERWNVDYSQGGLNASNRNGDSKGGFSVLAEKLRREIAEESAGQRPTPDDLRPIN